MYMLVAGDDMARKCWRLYVTAYVVPEDRRGAIVAFFDHHGPVMSCIRGSDIGLSTIVIDTGESHFHVGFPWSASQIRQAINNGKSGVAVDDIDVILVAEELAPAEALAA